MNAHYLIKIRNIFKILNFIAKILSQCQCQKFAIEFMSGVVETRERTAILFSLIQSVSNILTGSVYLPCLKDKFRTQQVLEILVHSSRNYNNHKLWLLLTYKLCT